MRRPLRRDSGPQPRYGVPFLASLSLTTSRSHRSDLCSHFSSPISSRLSSCVCSEQKRKDLPSKDAYWSLREAAYAPRLRANPSVGGQRGAALELWQ